MSPVVQTIRDLFKARGDRAEVRRVAMALVLAVGALLVLAGPAHARGGAGGISGGAAGGGSLTLQGGNSGFGDGNAAMQMQQYRHELHERHEYRHRYGDGSAELVRDRPDCGLGGPCQPPPPSERPDLDYGHRH